MSVRDKHVEAFKEEAYELLAELETSLLEMEGRPDDMELIGRVFRAMHTIKGSGAMFGFEEISKFTHEVETVFDLVRNGEIAVTKELVNLSLSARDIIKAMLDAPDGNTEKARAFEIAAALRKFIPKANVVHNTANNMVGPVHEEQSDVPVVYSTFRIRFRPVHDIFLRGTNPVYLMSLIDELRGLGESSLIAYAEEVPSLEEIGPELCYTYWDIILTTRYTMDKVRDVFVFVAGDCELKVDLIANGEVSFEGDYKKLGEILVERGDITPNDLRKVLPKQKKLGEMLVESRLVGCGQVESALLEQQHVKKLGEKSGGPEAVASLRVPSEKLDVLVDLVGELVTVQARLSQFSQQANDPDLMLISEEVERLTANLRDNTMGIRMLPIGTTFSKFKRLVRDLSNELGKEIELTTDGAETELDKTVIERLNDPLIHLIRNSIDHGIEMPDAREAKGKLRKGMVHLSAVHSGANVFIRIMDNGAGLDPEAIRAKAVQKGLITPETELSEKELFSLIFAPGFSTAKTVSSVSGRGVGMDVVKRGIEALRGTIEIESAKGAGTTITLMLPLTLAIIDGFLVRVCEEFFVIPLSLVVECMELTPAHRELSHGRDVVNVRDSIVPYIRLRERFNMNGFRRPDIEHLVITEVEGNRVGFVADQIIGEHQTVIKNLGTFYKEVEGVSGATILGDGTVALVLDVPKIVKSVAHEEMSAA